MDLAVATRLPRRSNAAKAIVAAGLACGILDFTAACFTWWLWAGINLARIAQGIASGLLGPQAYRGGTGTALLGVALHFFIAFSAAIVFYLASRKMKFMTTHISVSGPLYGVAVYIVMYWVVLPLSSFHRSPFALKPTIVAVLTHIFCVGLPIAIAIKKFAGAPGSRPAVGR